MSTKKTINTSNFDNGGSSKLHYTGYPEKIDPLSNINTIGINIRKGVDFFGIVSKLEFLQNENFLEKKFRVNFAFFFLL